MRAFCIGVIRAILDDTVIALMPCGCALFAPDHPRLLAINGVPIDSLMRVAGIRFRGHSPQRFRLRALNALTRIEDILTRSGAAAGAGLRVRLAGSRGDTTIHRAMSPGAAGRHQTSPSGPRSRGRSRYCAFP